MSKPPFRVAIITLSDRVAAGNREDSSGAIIREMILTLDAQIIEQSILPDDARQLSEKLIQLADREQADLILTTGGTGLGKRDFTPEATLSVIEKRVPGIEEAMRAAGITKTPYAMLSRAVVGIRGHTLIINLPGSPKGVKENLEVVLPVLPHAMKLLRDERIEDREHRYISD